jgi:hypothetical protein
VCHRIEGGSGPSFISGWLSCFCLFTEKGKWQGDHLSVNIWGKEITSEWPLVDTEDIPPGYVSVPVIVDDNGVEYKTQMFAGSFAVSKVNSTTLTPRSDWLIALK